MIKKAAMAAGADLCGIGSMDRACYVHPEEQDKLKNGFTSKRPDWERSVDLK